MNQCRSLMSKEFEKLEALLSLSRPSEREPQVDRGEATKLAARWKGLAHRDREQRIELPRGGALRGALRAGGLLAGATKLAARWKWLAHRDREQRIELPRGGPDRGALRAGWLLARSTKGPSG